MKIGFAENAISGFMYLYFIEILYCHFVDHPPPPGISDGDERMAGVCIATVLTKAYLMREQSFQKSWQASVWMIYAIYAFCEHFDKEIVVFAFSRDCMS